MFIFVGQSIVCDRGVLDLAARYLQTPPKLASVSGHLAYNRIMTHESYFGIMAKYPGEHVVESAIDRAFFGWRTGWIHMFVIILQL